MNISSSATTQMKLSAMWSLRSLIAVTQLEKLPVDWVSAPSHFTTGKRYLGLIFHPGAAIIG